MGVCLALDGRVFDEGQGTLTEFESRQIWL